jgi:hypothetical protein
VKLLDELSGSWIETPQEVSAKMKIESKLNLLRNFIKVSFIVLILQYKVMK